MVFLLRVQPIPAISLTGHQHNAVKPNNIAVFGYQIGVAYARTRSACDLLTMVLRQSGQTQQKTPRSDASTRQIWRSLA